MGFDDNYHPIIKHGVLENPPVMDVFPSQKNPDTSIYMEFPSAMFDYQQVLGNIWSHAVITSKNISLLLVP